METPKRIHLLGDGRHEEDLAGGTITPGMLIQKANTGRVVAHSTAGGYAEKAFAIEDALQGRTISDNYTIGERVSYVMCDPGDVVYAHLAAGEDVAIGDLLSSNGDGRLQERVGSEVAVAVALEALDLSDTGATHGRIRVRVL